MTPRVADVRPERVLPIVRDPHEPLVECWAKLGDDPRQGIAIIFVLAASEAVPRHDDCAAELVQIISGGQILAGLAIEETGKEVVAVLIEGRADVAPESGGKAVDHAGCRSRSRSAALRRAPQR